MKKKEEIGRAVPEICLVAPSQALADLTASIAQKRGEDIGIYVGVLDEGVRAAEELSKQGAKIFVSRKGTASVIGRKGFNVVKINTTLNDYLRHLNLMRQYSGKIAIVEYYEFIPELKKLCDYLKIEVASLLGYSGTQDYKDCVERAITSGASMLMGGGAQLPAEAKRLGIPYTVVENTKESINAALDVAQQLLRVQKKEAEEKKHYKIQLEKYTTVVDYAHDAIISVDKEDIITLANTEAFKILQWTDSCVGKDIANIVPAFEFSALGHDQKKELNKIVKIHNLLISVNKIPIIINGIFEGAVYMFQDIKDIQKSEEKIRLQLYKKGHIAKYDFVNIIGNSHSIERTKEIAKGYANTNFSILITGETGTGKELFAQSIHNNSPRKNGPFVAINCAALPKDLLSSELFGYEEGAFTGAAKGGKPGIFEVAHGGTIFLDEIGEIPMETQVQLLRVLQEREVRRLSSDRVIPIDVRVICATNKDLAKEVKEGRFRADLFYRINVLKLAIPPLREREEDIPLIIDHFLQRLTDQNYLLIKEYMQTLYPKIAGYSWPGNVRELLGITERIATLLENNFSMDIDLNMILENIDSAFFIEDNRTIEQLQKSDIVAALRNHAYHRGKTADALGVSRSTLWRLINKYHISQD
ncbi:sigma 54-interacting transcriptional regulator [Caproiciproducens sp. R1]|uniref:sigma 54-interacting transcriptional regulator n=1 Tax=Caproiciproducens sp. R1 TaxID=3435000 RepID=UPI00403326EB